ncbi:phosphoglycerate mutase family protein [Mycobacterium sp. M1]|uniref:Phosphoglycerate mutase family protein n=1 Tax=Mycolicibacter acidiphilus TaxID=2835306 RepID=A0ABS5RK71_9MYCO|nr:phosphoglycerate mutase family protein [Mycolicibacter acidiphilus]MBS9533993.1 phosphoglycerate mutase family protein [Mycolicibacter acidiphilus]
MQRIAARLRIGGAVGVLTAAVIAGAPVAAPLSGIALPGIELTAADMVLDLVRHGQSTDNANGIVGTTAPGAPLTALGEQQSITVGAQLYNGGDNDIDAIYASDFLRAQQTAWPLDQLLAGGGGHDPIPGGPTPLLDPSQILPGLGEINAGFANGTPELVGGLPYILPILAWSLFGQLWVPMLGSTINPNGVVFADRFNDAIQTMYDAGGTTGGMHDVAFTHGASMLAWTLMTVKNPDLSVILADPMLPNAGQVVVQGNPTDGWTLVSWDGHDVPQTPDLFTGLFVDWRDLITAPQIAGWHVLEALQGGDQTVIAAALQTGFDQVLAAVNAFPQSVVDTISGGLGA